MITLSLLIGLYISSGAQAQEAPLTTLSPSSKEARSRSSTEPELQAQVSTAMAQIMSTKIGLGICRGILNGDPAAIEHHLGVDGTTAKLIAQSCVNFEPQSWISPSGAGQLEKLSVSGAGKRTYVFVINGDSIPFDSWTEPFSNTTVFVIHSNKDKPINRQRLIQLLAHETAVYFDSKAMLGHSDAMSIRELKEQVLTGNSLGLDPKVAVMNPIIAHTMTFVRALQVERAIVEELVGRGIMERPEEYKDPMISNLLSPNCGEACLEKIVQDMSEIYLPLALPLVALSPTYRSKKRPEISILQSVNQEIWNKVNSALDFYPRRYIEDMNKLKQKPFMELIQFFGTTSDGMNGPFSSVERAFRDVLYRQDWQTVRDTRVLSPQQMTLLEFMKAPLLSGSNILLSNGPRVRIRTGGTL